MMTGDIEFTMKIATVIGLKEELTVEEIEKLLGYKIKIKGEKK